MIAIAAALVIGLALGAFVWVPITRSLCEREELERTERRRRYLAAGTAG